MTSDGFDTIHEADPFAARSIAVFAGTLVAVVYLAGGDCEQNSEVIASRFPRTNSEAGGSHEAPGVVERHGFNVAFRCGNPVGRSSGHEERKHDSRK